MMEVGSFREDLFYRINIFPIVMPPLSERVSDIPQLARARLTKLDPGKNYRLSDSAIPFLKLIEYRGNIRELRDILNRAMVMSDTDELDHVAIELALPETGCV